MILVVDLEEKSTGDFSVSGGYSTTDGALAEVSISERNFLGRGLYAKASVTYGQYARGYSLSFVEPYLLDYRVALGLDLFQREQLANSYISYGTKTSASARGSASACARICRCSSATRSISRRSRCRITCAIVTTIRPVRTTIRARPISPPAGPPSPFNTSALGCYSTAKPRCRSARNCRTARR